MTVETWHEARLIPTSGIAGADEQERRATSAMLAVMSVVREFSKAVLGPLGAPAGTVETFVEVPFVLGEKRCQPDGLIRVSRRGRTWTALVEVKTGKNDLQIEQLDNYLDVAREQGFRCPHHDQQRDSGHRRTAPDEGRQAQAEEGRPAPLALDLSAVHCGHAERAPRDLRSRTGVDSRRADSVLGAPTLGSFGIGRHGPALGGGTRCRDGGHAPGDRQDCTRGWLGGPLPRSGSQFPFLDRDVQTATART